MSLVLHIFSHKPMYWTKFKPMTTFDEERGDHQSHVNMNNEPNFMVIHVRWFPPHVIVNITAKFPCNQIVVKIFSLSDRLNQHRSRL